MNTPQAGMPEEHHHTQLFVGLGVLVLIGILFAGGLWFVDSRAIESTEILTSGETLTTAREGRVVPGFPKELLAEGNDAVEESYSLSYENGLRQPVVRYRSTLTLREAIVMTAEHFESKGWIIVQEANIEAARVTNFYAVKEGSEANVTFIYNNEDESVIIEIAVVLTSN